jgi:flagellar biosynthetic protein FliR
MGELVAITAQYRETFLLVFFRLGAMLAFAPLIGHRSVPVLHRAALAGLVAAILTPLLGRVRVRGDDGLGLVMAIAGEIFIGLAIAFVASLLVSAAQVAGELVGFQMGLGFASVYDPGMAQQTSVVARFHEIMALLLLLTLDGHHVLLRVVAGSFERIRPGAVVGEATLAAGVVAQGSKLFRAGLELAAPLVAVLFVVNIVMALLARVAPSLNIFALSAPLTVAVGLVALVDTLPHVASVVTRLVGELGGQLGALLLGIPHGA